MYLMVILLIKLYMLKSA